MLGQRLANPHIFPFIRTNQQDQIVSGGIVRVEEVCDDTQEAQAPGYEN